ncbi:MAG: glycosyltransferase family 2 protein [Tabrizicola sp.]|nr:glycosyltransferase family 2 protein [Tabrizicola sp.]
MGLMSSYRLRLQRRRLIARALLRRGELTSVVNRLGQLPRHPVLVFTTLRNERVRLPYFLQYYRGLGVDHFLMVDNGSDDGSRDYLAEQPDVSLWDANASYGKSRYGMDWIMYLLRQYGEGNWCLTVDVDEFLVYPFCETRPLRALTDWLDASNIRTFSAMLLDMYPKGNGGEQLYLEGQNPFEIAEWFDAGNYTISPNPSHSNLWIQGGPRARTFFPGNPKAAPALNKIPLVKWRRPYAYVSSTHMMLPRGLNLTYDQSGGEKASGCLLHAKFLNTLAEKAAEESQRREHYRKGHEYAAYHRGLSDEPDFWCRWSERYTNWKQLETLGLISKGNWA